jgi:hypothetical protein
MCSKVKFGTAFALIFVAMATVPALVCLTYLDQTANSHNCCPQERPQNTAVARCCTYSPAIISASVDAPPPVVGGVERSVEFTAIATRFEAAVMPAVDASPPGCSSILRI